MDDLCCHPSRVVDARFVIHHGSGSITTTNLLVAPEPLTCWPGVHVQTTVTVQPGDPIHLVGEFVCLIDYDGTGAFLEPNAFPWQIQVPDGVPLRLEITAASDGGVQVDWPALYRDWRLEAADGPGLPWAPVERPVVLENQRCIVGLPLSASTSGTRLFRLSR